MIKILQNFTYILLQIILLPISLIGMSYANYKQQKNSKKAKISYTAGQVIQGKWILHYFNIRKDYNIIKFIKNFPAESHIGFYMMFSAAILANNLVNFIPKALIKNNLDDISSYSFLFFRTKKIDQLVKCNIEKVEQFVVLGAGFDLRSIRYNNDKLKVFELDKKNTQKLKLDTLKKAKIITNNITYIECDLNNNEWSIDLIKQGFNKNKKTLFLFESVGCYLEEDIVNNILSTIKSISAKGSMVIQDIYSTRFLHQDEFQRVKRGKKLIQNFGENWNFTMNMDNNVEAEISKLLEKNNLIPLENYICGKNSTKSKNPFYAISLSKV
ncbi:SAM-dependent methyltransferase [Flavobacteriales bacterium]|nr:SAM-dependent methyltransferase [Flavobacteriales bacterium]